MTLIKKLESAPEGSRELDAEIAERVGWTRGQAYIQGDDCHVGTWISPAGVVRGLPYFTTSIDAALTLIPEIEGGNKAGLIHSALWQQRIGDIPDERIALAICIAALKAREQGNE